MAAAWCRQGKPGDGWDVSDAGRPLIRTDLNSALPWLEAVQLSGCFFLTFTSSRGTQVGCLYECGEPNR